MLEMSRHTSVGSSARVSASDSSTRASIDAAGTTSTARVTVSSDSVGAPVLARTAVQDIPRDAGMVTVTELTGVVPVFVSRMRDE